MAGPISVNFQQSDSQKLIFVAMTVVVVAAFVERYSGVKETATVPQIFIGAFVATAILLMLSYFIPQFAVGLAVTAAVGMIVSKGEPFWSAINAVVKAPNNVPQPKTPTAPSAPHA